MTGPTTPLPEQAIEALWTDPFLGQLALTNANRPTPARSNLLYYGWGNLVDGALAATGVCCSVPIPVCNGDVITTVNLPLGATVNSSPTHQIAALYSGIATPALLAQSTDTGTAVVTASAVQAFPLASQVTVTNAIAPNGFLYAMVSYTATTLPLAVSATVTAAVSYRWFTSLPLFLSMTHGSAVGATAPSTIASPSIKAVAPIIVLT